LTTTLREIKSNPVISTSRLNIVWDNSKFTTWAKLIQKGTMIIKSWVYWTTEQFINFIKYLAYLVYLNMLLKYDSVKSCNTVTDNLSVTSWNKSWSW